MKDKNMGEQKKKQTISKLEYKEEDIQ